VGALVGATVGIGVGLLTEYDGAAVGDSVGTREGVWLGGGDGLLAAAVKVKLTTPEVVAEELTTRVVVSTTETTVTVPEKTVEVDVTTDPTLMIAVLGTVTIVLPIEVVQSAT